MAYQLLLKQKCEKPKTVACVFSEQSTAITEMCICTYL